MRRAVRGLLSLGACQALLACSLVTDLSGLSDPRGEAGGGQGGSSTSTGASAGGGGGSSGPCPGGDGPPMISVGEYCIDSTEVTNRHYQNFLAAGVPTQNMTSDPLGCAWNVTYEPAFNWPPQASEDDLPVVFVDWCDAYAYCAWAGKRLCGRIGGGPNPYEDPYVADATSSQWYNACSSGGSVSWPYGDAYDATACVGSDYDGMSMVQPTDVAHPVMEAASCHGPRPPFDQIYGMSGNVSEWEDSCNGDLGAADLCRRRGGSFMFEGQDIRCADISHSNRQHATPSIGFRCCS